VHANTPSISAPARSSEIDVVPSTAATLPCW